MDLPIHFRLPHREYTSPNGSFTLSENRYVDPFPRHFFSLARQRGSVNGRWAQIPAMLPPLGRGIEPSRTWMDRPAQAR